MQQVGFTDQERRLAVLGEVAKVEPLDEGAFDEVIGHWYSSVAGGRRQYLSPARGGEGLLALDGQGRVVLTARGRAVLAQLIPVQGRPQEDERVPSAPVSLSACVAADAPVMHPTYLPFSEQCLQQHFAAVSGGEPNPAQLTYYRKSIAARKALAPDAVVTGQELARARQMEKDERFWVVSALLRLLHESDDTAARAHRFGELLRRAGLPELSGVGPWEQVLDGSLELYFEANLPSPKRYRDWLEDNVAERTLVPHIREAASKPGVRFEGQTKVDALLLAPATGVSVLFEAKVLSDVSTDIVFDVARNQLARLVDVSLEPARPGDLATRDPERSCVVLLTPGLVRGEDVDDVDNPLRRSRLYGWLFDAYRTPEHPLLRQHLAHRRDAERVAGAASRLGWATWEDCEAIVPGACSWLTTSTNEVEA